MLPPSVPLVRRRDEPEPTDVRRRRVAGLLARGPASRFGSPWWFAISMLAILLASDYELRQRDVTAALESSVDLQILLEVGVFAAVAGALLVFGLRGGSGYSALPKVFMWGFTVMATISVLYAPFVGVAAVRAVQAIIVAALMTTLINQATRVHVHLFAHAFLVLVMISVAIGVTIPFPRLRLQEDRFNWMFVHPVIAGGYLVFAVLLCVGYLRLPRTRQVPWVWPPFVYGGILLVSAAALVATQTRGSLGAALFGVFVLLAVSARRKARADLILVGGLGVLALLAFTLPALIEIASRGEGIETLATLNSRTELWNEAVASFSQQPFFGNGFFAARGLFLDFIGLGGAHNAYIEVLVDLGLFGVFWWGGLLIVSAREITRHLRARRFDPDAAVLAGILAAIVVNAVTTEGAGTAANVQHVFLFLVAGWSSLLSRERRDELVAERHDPDQAPAANRYPRFPRRGAVAHR